MNNPREFWIGVTGDPNKPMDERVYAYIKKPIQIPGEDIIRVREVMTIDDECDLITDLIHQRSIAFDESKKYRELAEELAEKLKKALEQK
jgi:hypothetical protein